MGRALALLDEGIGQSEVARRLPNLPLFKTKLREITADLKQKNVTMWCFQSIFSQNEVQGQ